VAIYQEPRLTVGQCSKTGRKQQNEDSYGLVTPTGSLVQTKGIAMAITDGVSASQSGKEASEICIKSFLEDYYGTHETWAVKKSVATVLCAINQWLYHQSQAQFATEKAMATTFSGLIFKMGMAHIFHVGDSRIALLRNGTLEPLTTDHSVNTASHQGLLTRAFGIGPELEIDYHQRAVEPGDIFIFTTDGIHDFISPAKIIETLNEHKDDLQSAAQKLASYAYSNQSQDNLTCQLVRIDEPGSISEQAHLEQLQALPFPPELSPGLLFEGYKIERELHASNRSQVYLARDEERHEQVVIKTPSVNFQDNPDYIERFMREEWVGKRIQSPNVVRVLAPKKQRAFLYYITEYSEGMTLQTWSESNPNPSLVEVRGIADQIASGLRAFHRKDIIHQDLKPGNIVIDKNGTVKIIDFGSTAIAGLEEVDEKHKEEKLLGTVDYTAPELHFGHGPSKRSDIYAFGVIVYEMLTGKHPFGHGFTTAKSVAKRTLTPATTHRPSLPFWVSQALSKAVHQDPNQRYSVLSAFMADLSHPNPAFSHPNTQPFLQREPTTFWKTIAIASLFINLLLLVILSQ